MKKHLLLTGATGQVGQYLVRDLLQEDQPLAVLIRGHGQSTAKERLERVLHHWERELPHRLARPRCLEGDIAAPGCGLSQADQHWIREHCDGVIHNAASLTFVGADRGKDPWLSNLTGTQNVLDLCHDAGIRRMHYVSTAYVCGTRTELIREDDLNRGQDFRNDYEASKFESEMRVRAAGFDSLTVYRPAMIVGDSHTGYTATYHGLYTYMQYAYVLSQYLERDADGRFCLPIRLNITGAEGRNLVPIDWVSAVMAHILLHPEHHGRTYHLTPAEPITARAIEAGLAMRLHYYGPSYVGPNGLAGQELNEIEKQFYASVTTYQPYWNQEPTFDFSNTQAAAPHLPCPRVDEAFIMRLLDFAITDRWGRGKAKAERKKAKAVLSGK